MTHCSTPRCPRVLIVEDEVLIAFGLKTEMEALGFEVSGLAASAKQATSLAMDAKPDLVIMDIYLNGARDGIEAARWLHQVFGVPIVFVTAYADDAGILQRVHQCLPDAPVLSKPLYGDRLSAAIGQLRAS